MGEMADYTLECFEAFENMKADCLNGGMSIEDAYENGVVDEMGMEAGQGLWNNSVNLLDLDVEYLKAQLEFEKSSVHEHLFLEYSGEIALSGDYNKLERKVKSRLKTFKLLLAFANFFVERGYLTTKQLDIVETNWDGGGIKFMQDLQQHHESMISDLKRIISIMEKVLG